MTNQGLLSIDSPMKKIVALLILSIQFITITALSYDRLSIVSWNVENLFDSEHDKGKWDYAFLPKDHPEKQNGCRNTSKTEYYLNSCMQGDWTRAKVLLKYQQIKRMLETLPKKPDIFVLIEIENPQVLKELAQVLGYKGWAISHWDDERGVDTGILFNTKRSLQFVKTAPVEIPLPNNQTRPILQVQFRFDNQDLHLYINHWPAAMAPEHQRALAARQLRNQIEAENRMRRNPIFSVALGDFNVNNTEFPRPLLSIFDTGWNYRLIDMDSLSREYNIPNPPGTYFFAKDRAWNMFDRVLVSKQFFQDRGLKIPINQYKISNEITTSIQIRETGEIVKGVPFRYNQGTLDPSQAGFSDHFPVYFEIVAP